MLRALIPLLILALSPRYAGAQALDTDVVEARLAFLEERLDASQRHGQYWHWGWMGISVAGTAAGIGQAATQNGDDQAGRIVEATTAAVGVVYLLVAPMEARLGADPIRAMPSRTASDRFNQLHAAEARLLRNAERSRERTSWKMHLGNIAFNVAAGGVLGAVGNLGDAAILAGAGTLSGAIQFWSEPARPLDDWKDYEAFKASGANAAPERPWSLSPTTRGIAFRLRF